MEDKLIKLNTERNHAVLDKFFRYTKNSNLPLLDALLTTHNLDVNQIDSSGKSSLYYGIVNQNSAVVELLLKKGANPRQMNYVPSNRGSQHSSCYEPPIVTATRIRNLHLMDLLISYNADVNQQCELRTREQLVYQDKTALHYASEDNCFGIVHFLLLHRADVNICDKSGEIAVHKVVRCKNCELQCDILKLLCDFSSDINCLSKIECTPLYLATFYGCFRKLDLLIQYGADCSQSGVRENSYGTPLHVAASKDRYDLAESLIVNGANLNLKNALDYTPLQLNINAHIKSDIAKLLVFHGAQVNMVDRWNMTLLASCIRNMRLDCESLCKMIVLNGYDLKRDSWLKPLDLRSSEENMNALDIPIPDGRVRSLCDYLWKRTCTPLRLKEICCIVIRQTLIVTLGNGSVIEKIKKLTLPELIKNYISLEDGSLVQLMKIGHY